MMVLKAAYECEKIVKRSRNKCRIIPLIILTWVVVLSLKSNLYELSVSQPERSSSLKLKDHHKSIASQL